MASELYLLSAVGSVCAFYFIWTLGIRKLFLDILRERLFELRFSLFNLGMNEEMVFDDEAYRSLEILFNGLLRFAHRLTFLTYVLSSIETSKVQKEKDYVSVSAQISLKVSRLEPDVQAKISEILKEAMSAVLIYLAASSLFFLTLYCALKLLDAVGIVQLGEKEDDAREAIEREAYIMGSKQGLNLSAAAA